MAYLSDHGPLALGPGQDGHGPTTRRSLDLARDADLLIHDAQYVAAELAVAEASATPRSTTAPPGREGRRA